MSVLSQYKKYVPTIIVQSFCLLMVAPLVLSIIQLTVAGANVRHLLHESGEVSERLIILTLLCTPLFIIFGWNLPIKYRRTIGVYSFVALLVHVLAQLWAQGFTWNTLFSNTSFALGSIAFFIMIALTATSLDSIKRAMGKAWKRLHYGVYAVAILMEVHVLFVDLPRLNFHGVVFGIFIALLLIIRLPIVRKPLQARWQNKRNMSVA